MRYTLLVGTEYRNIVEPFIFAVSGGRKKVDISASYPAYKIQFKPRFWYVKLTDQFLSALSEARFINVLERKRR